MHYNLTRYLNGLVSGGSYLAGSVFHRPFLAGMPPALGVELTNFCNLRCPECPSGSGVMKRERGYMDISLFEKIISELKPFLFNMNLYFQGEPMLHPRFFEILNLASDIPTTVATNGHFLSEKNCTRLADSQLSRLIISVDGLTQETYSSYRINGNLEMVLEGIRNVVDAKKKYRSHLKIQIQFLVNSMNECQMEDAKDLAGSLGVDLAFKSMQVMNQDRIEAWMPSVRKYRRYTREIDCYKINSTFPRRCARLWFNPVITWDGKVLPCCFDKDGKYIMGDLKNESFRTIWKGEKFSNFRNDVLTGREKIDICRNCTSGLNL
jgi:radical SAM protein with 4Fe4S-binding SPASM domain